MKRKAIPLKIQLAASLLALEYWRASALKMEDAAIPYEHSKHMTADQIISLFHLDHYPILHSDGGPDEPWNLRWIYIGAHREKTKQDMKGIAKSKRIKRKLAGETRPRRKIPSRPFPTKRARTT